jgi:hypothetical protein
LYYQAFFPKNRSNWKTFSSWEPPEKISINSIKGSTVDTRFPQELKVKKGYSWNDQVGIVVGALCEDDSSDGDEGDGEKGKGKGLVVWTVEVSDYSIEIIYLGPSSSASVGILTNYDRRFPQIMNTVISQRQRVILETDRKKQKKNKDKVNTANATSDDGENGRKDEEDPGDEGGGPDRDAEDSDSEEGLAILELEPSAEAIAKLTDYGEWCAVPNKICLPLFPVSFHDYFLW